MNRQVTDIGQIAITVASVETALGFYRDILGLEFLFSPSPQLAFLRCGDVRIMLSTPQGAGAVGENSILYYRVEDMEGTFRDFTERGAKSEREPAMAAQLPDHALWLAFLRDPDGNLVGLMEEKAS